MKPPLFHYFDPTSRAEAIALLAEHGGDAKVLAGGQSLMPVLNMRLATPRALVDINRIPDLSGITAGAGRLQIGAMTRHRAVERSEIVASANPLLQAAVRHIGHQQIRTRGTIGGSLAHNDPAAELPAVAVCLDAELVLEGPDGERTVAADDFFGAYMTSDIAPDEILTAVRLPNLVPGAGWSFQEMARRAGDFALAAVAAVVELDDDGRCRDVRLALAGVGDRATRARQAEAALRGQVPDPEQMRAAVAQLRAEVDPGGDVHATAEYRRHLAGVLALRALTQAAEGAKGGHGHE